MSEIEIKKAKKKGIILGLTISAPMVIIAGIFIYSALIRPIVQKNMTVEQLLYDRLNEWKENSNKSGIVALKPMEESGSYEMRYYFYPFGTMEYDKELAITISKDLIQTFMDKDELNFLRIYIYLPYRDAYLNTVWKPYMSFDLDRNTLSKYNYENFYSTDLYRVCDNLMVYEK